MAALVRADVEIDTYCVESVLQIREMLTKELASQRGDDPLSEHLKAMRAACRKFLDRMQSSDAHARHYRDRYDLGTQMFFTALGELRATMGIHIACVATQYGIDVENELASILPAADEDKIYPELR